MANKVIITLLLFTSLITCAQVCPPDTKGKVVLQKNVINGVNTLTQSMFNKSNAVYVVTYDYSIGEIENNVLPIRSSDSSVVINTITYYYKGINLPAGKCFVLKDRRFSVLLNSDRTNWLKDDCIVADKDRIVYVGSQIPTTTVYEIKDYILVPDNCILEFKGGRINNGVIVGNNSTIEARKTQIFGGALNVCGTWNCDVVYPQWFGAKGDGKTDNTNALIKWADFPCKNKLIPPGVYNTMEIHSYGLNGSVIKGYGATLKYSRLDIYEHHASMHNHAVLSNTPSLYLNGADFSGGDLTIYGLTIDGNKDNFVYESHPVGNNGLIWAFGIDVYCLENFRMVDVTVKNTFMNGVFCHGVNNFYADRCKLVHIGECTNYTPDKLNYYWEGIGCGSIVPIYSKHQNVSIPFKSAKVTHSYFEDIAGSYFSANCELLESGWNTVVNNRGYGHELSGDIQKKISIHDNSFNRINGAFLQLYNSNIANTPDLSIEIERNTVTGYGEADSRTKKTVGGSFIRIDDSYNNYKGNNRRHIIVKDNSINLNGCRLINPKYSDVLFDNNRITLLGTNEIEAIYVTKYSDTEQTGTSDIIIRNNTINLGSFSLFNNNAPAGNINIDNNIIETDYAGDGKHVYSPYCIRTGASYKSLVLNRNTVRGFNVFWMTTSSSYGGVVATDNDVNAKWLMYTVFPQWFPKEKPLKAKIKGNKLKDNGIINNAFNVEYSNDSDVLEQ